MGEVLQDYERPPVRPTFITVLCILTFIGSGWGVISETTRYFTADSQAAAFSKVKEKANSDLQKNKKQNGDTKFAVKVVNSINASPEDIKKGAISNIAGSLLCLAGAIMMWRLKRTGFYLYLAGILVSIISPFVIFGSGNFVAIISSLFIGFVGLIFVILYGVNLKYMK